MRRRACPASTSRVRVPGYLPAWQESGGVRRLIGNLGGAAFRSKPARFLESCDADSCSASITRVGPATESLLLDAQAHNRFDLARAPQTWPGLCLRQRRSLSAQRHGPLPPNVTNMSSPHRNRLRTQGHISDAYLTLRLGIG